MKKCAIVLNGDDVVKVTNYPRKYSKLNNNSNVKILEECYPENVEERFLYWKENYIPIPKEKPVDPFDVDKSEYCSALIWKEDGSLLTCIQAGRHSDINRAIKEYLGIDIGNSWIFSSKFPLYKTDRYEIYPGILTAWEIYKNM